MAGSWHPSALDIGPIGRRQRPTSCQSLGLLRQSKELPAQVSPVIRNAADHLNPSLKHRNPAGATSCHDSPWPRHQGEGRLVGQIADRIAQPVRRKGAGLRILE